MSAGPGDECGEYAMSTEALNCPKLNDGVGSFLVAHNKAHALRYDNLPHVMINLDRCGQVQEKPKRERKPGKAQAELAALSERLAALEAENALLTDRFTDELDRLADRLAKLESRPRPWWWRVFGRSVEPAEPPRNRASEKLRALYFGSARRGQRPN
jgi:cell division protein FtsB